MSTDPRAACANVPVSSRKQCYAYPVEVSNLVQLMRVFSFILVTVQVRTERRRSAYRCRNSALEVQYHCLISYSGPCRSFSASSSVLFRSPTCFTRFRLALAGSVHNCLLAAVSRFALVLCIFHVSIRAAAPTSCSSASLCAASKSTRPEWRSSARKSDWPTRPRSPQRRARECMLDVCAPKRSAQLCFLWKR